MFNHDIELEKRSHPENFDHSIEEDAKKAEKEEEKQELKKKLFKKIYGSMIDVEFCDLAEQEVANICLGVLTLYKNKYLGFARGVELEEML